MENYDVKPTVVNKSKTPKLKCPHCKQGTEVDVSKVEPLGMGKATVPCENCGVLIKLYISRQTKDHIRDKNGCLVRREPKKLSKKARRRLKK